MIRRLAALVVVLIAALMIVGPAMAGVARAPVRVVREPAPPIIKICIGADVVVIVANIKIVIGPGECGQAEPPEVKPEPKPSPKPRPKPHLTVKPKPRPRPRPRPPIKITIPRPQPQPRPKPQPVVRLAPRPKPMPSTKPSIRPKPPEEPQAIQRHRHSPLKKKRNPLGSVLIIAVVSVTVSALCGAVFAAH
jgi:hypothetical protein